MNCDTPKSFFHGKPHFYFLNSAPLSVVGAFQLIHHEKYKCSKADLPPSSLDDSHKFHAALKILYFPNDAGAVFACAKNRSIPLH
jgi:hypothetical protein